MLKSVEKKRKIMAIAVLPSNDHASNVVRVIAEVTRPRPKPLYYLSMSGSLAGPPVRITRPSIPGRPGKVPKFPATSRHETTGGSSIGFSC